MLKITVTYLIRSEGHVYTLSIILYLNGQRDSIAECLFYSGMQGVHNMKTQGYFLPGGVYA